MNHYESRKKQTESGSLLPRGKCGTTVRARAAKVENNAHIP